MATNLLDSGIYFEILFNGMNLTGELTLQRQNFLELPKHLVIQHSYTFFCAFLENKLGDTDNKTNSEYLSHVFIKKSSRYIISQIEQFNLTVLNHFLVHIRPVLSLQLTLPDFIFEFVGKIIAKIYSLEKPAMASKRIYF